MRTEINLNKKWAFTKQSRAVPETMPTDWYWVDLPHTWNGIDGQDGNNDYYRGTCYYAKQLLKSELPESERYYLEIRGANSSADVYVNGRCLAHHDGGYSTWRVDITDALEKENLLVVAVDNSPNSTVYPQNADFTFYGGLYRDVKLLCVPASHFDLDRRGGPGIRVTPTVSGENASVAVETFVTNPAEGMVRRYTVLDAEGRVVKTLETPEDLAVLEIPGVHLWNGRIDPYLYTAKAELISESGVVDEVSARFGCRTFSIDPERGFILNGREYPLRGVSRHQDRLGIGNALLPEHHLEDIDLICEVGATAVRLAHYQHDQYFYDLCDERGLIVWAEIPYISQHMPSGRENTISQMREMVEQNYNHASIVVWGLSNEITMLGETDPDMLENHRILNSLVHELDRTRLTTMACLSTCPTDCEYVTIPDTIAYNHYFGWYGGDVSKYAPWFDAFHAKFPDTPIGCSEYGCEALNWHSSEPDTGDYTEEYQAHFHEEAIKQLFPRKYLWCTFVWNMFDFGADTRGEGGENGQNHKGLVTIDRKYKKDSFYAYKAWLSPEPFVHICGKRYVDRVEAVTKVTVYSNLDEVELFANGVSLGKKRSGEHFFYFDVPNEGETVLLARAGECHDKSVIRKVEVFNEAYRLREKNAVLNWFDIVEVDGFCSLNTKMGIVARNPEGMALLESEIFSRAGINTAMFEMFEAFSVLRLIGLLEATAKTFDREQLLALNERLNKIKKL